jgi:hypothetical protein
MKRYGLVATVVGVGLAVGTSVAAPEKGAPATGVEIVKNEAARRVEVRIDGQPFTAYVWPESLTKPVLYPVLTAKGTAVTRGFPLDPRPGERTDHPHQVGLWLSYGDVNGVDFWNNSKALPQAQQAKMGRSRHVKVVEAVGGPKEGRLRVAIEWVMPDGSVVLDEDTTFVFRGGPGTRIIDRTSRLTARAPVTFVDNKEGFLGMRLARALEHPTKEPATFTDAQGRATTVAVLDNTGVTGLYHSSEGKEGDAVWATRGRWVALSGRLGGEDVTLAILDHPENPGAPTYWHARGYGLFAANPLGQKVFSNGQEELNLKLAAGASTTFRYRVAVLSTPFTAGAVEALYKEMAGSGSAAADAPALEADRARFDAQVKGDVAALDRLLGSDLTYVHSSGALETKDVFLGGIKSGKYKYKAITAEDVAVRSYGDSAVLGGKATIDVAADGKDIHVVVRYTDVWVKRDGRWQMVAWHSTRLGP